MFVRNLIQQSKTLRARHINTSAPRLSNFKSLGQVGKTTIKVLLFSANTNYFYHFIL